MLTAELKLPAGAIRGVPRDPQGVLAFKGIPYAAPPVGELRWRPPQDAAPWKGVKEAQNIGNPCVGAPIPMAVVRKWTRNQSEDGLTLNVWTRAESVDAGLPVLVWIHGGGFEFGASTFFGCEGHRLAAQGAVVVGMNYRLGVFGFLALPELDGEGTPSGNYGLQDMIKALQWVRANVSCFGGDPDNVTIFGESAGSHAVGMLMASPLARGLFHKAIGQSGAYWDTYHGSLATKAEAQAHGRKLKDKLGAASLADLRAVPADRLNASSAWNFLLDPMLTAFSPNIDGYVIPESPAAVFERGGQSDVPLLGGWCRDEHAFFMSHALPHGSAPSFRNAAARQFGADRLAEFLAVYPAANRAQARQSAQLLVGDLLISEQTWEWLGTHRATSKSPVWVYNYQYASPYSPRPVHGADLAFVFGSVDESYIASKAPAGAADRELSNRMIRYWVNFARTGDPNGPQLPAWPAYQGAGSAVMRFASPTASAPEDGTARFRFIQSFRKNGRLPESWRSVKGAIPDGLAAVLRRILLWVK